MKAIEFDGQTRVLGKAQGYQPLPIIDTMTNDLTPMMVSAWKPTDEELAVLNNGGFVMVQILGIAHPPIKLDVLRNE